MGGIAGASCSDIFSNAGGDWGGCLAGQDVVSGNMCSDPLFCDTVDYTISDNSPCMPENNTCADSIGAMLSGCDLTGVDNSEHVGAGVPRSFLVHQNVPNPFNPQTTIQFDLPQMSRVRLCVYDLAGRQVKMLVEGDSMAAGQWSTVWNGRNDSDRQVGAGVYFYRLEAGGFSQTKRMTLVK